MKDSLYFVYFRVAFNTSIINSLFLETCPGRFRWRRTCRLGGAGLAAGFPLDGNYQASNIIVHLAFWPPTFWCRAALVGQINSRPCSTIVATGPRSTLCWSFFIFQLYVDLFYLLFVIAPSAGTIIPDLWGLIGDGNVAGLVPTQFQTRRRP